MPRIAKKDMQELPKPVLKLGTLGFFPMNQLAVSYAASGLCDVILGYQDNPQHEAFQSNPTIKIKKSKSAKKSDTFNLVGNYFKSPADAFYRGKLPQVIVAAPQGEELKFFVNEFLEFMNKLVSLGFILDKENPVQELVPCYVIATPGLFYSGLMLKISKGVHNIPNLSDEIKENILQRFCRGVVQVTGQFEPVGKEVTLLDVPRRIKIAGGSYMTQQTIQNVLSHHEIVTVIENSVENPTERLEFEQAARRYTHVILPKLKQAKVMSAKELKQIQEQVYASIFEIGLRRQAFEALDDLPSLVTNNAQGLDATSFRRSDVMDIQGLSLYAKMLGLEEACGVFKKLHKTIEDLVDATGKA